MTDSKRYLLLINQKRGYSCLSIDIIDFNCQMSRLSYMVLLGQQKM